jgi:site-specific recombinase XerD
LNIIEESTIREIEQYLTNDLKMKLNTVGKRLKNLKTFLNILYKRKLIHCNPFEMYGIKVPKEKVYNIALAEEELIELENLDLTNNLSLEHVRDHFLIMCYTSLRYSDYSNFINCDLSMNVVNVWSQKTGELSCVPILPPVARIISKYNGKLPKLISSQKMALYIKEVCGMIPSLCRMTSKAFTRGGRRVVEESPRYMMISNHTARRTFVTLMKRWGIDDATIMKVTGHRDARTLKTYDKMQQEEVVLKLIQDVSGKFGSII